MADNKDETMSKLIEAQLRTMEALAKRIEGLSVDREGNADVLERLASMQQTIADQNNQTLRQIHRPRNEFPPEISEFNLRGDKDFARPPLKCEMHTPWFRPWDQSSLTREEVELLNLLEPGEYTLKRNDGTKVIVQVEGKYALGDSTKLERLTIAHPSAFGNAEHARMKSLPDTLRSMLGRKAKDVITMEEEEGYIRLSQSNAGEPLKHAVSVGA